MFRWKDEPLNHPSVSVIIPAYNHGQLIAETLSSVFAQTYTNLQVIVVNDGSSDNTAEVLSPMVTAGQIVYVEQANAGQAAARNRGLSVATGDYIAFLDDDDIWPVDKLQWQVEALEKDAKIEAIAGVAQFIGPDGAELSHRSECVPRLTFESLFKGNPLISPGQVLVRSSSLKRTGGLDPQFWGADDWDLWFNLARNAPIVMHDRVALCYRVHKGNATRQGRRLYLNSRAVVEKQLKGALRSDRRQLRRRAYHMLATAYTSRLISDAKDAVRAGRWRESAKDLFAVGLLLRGAIAMPSLLWNIFLILLPVRIKLGFLRLFPALGPPQITVSKNLS